MARRQHHKFTRDVVDRLMRGIRMSMAYEDASNFAGISYDTFLNWRNGKFPRSLDDDQKRMKIEFPDMLTRAEGDAVAGLMSRIMQGAAQGDWKAAAWILEHRYPQRYGKQLLEVTGKDGGPIELSTKSRQLIEQFAAEEGIAGDQEELVAAVESYLAGEREVAE